MAANNVNIFEPGIEVPYVHSWTVGLQRSLGPDTAIEVRYVGNRNMNAWTTENWNEDIVFENGFFNEFRQAQANLAANVAAGRGGTFAYTGAPGTAPLPIFLAYFQGVGGGAANHTASYTSTNFSNSASTGHLGYYEPDVADAANDLHNNTTFRANAIRAGLPANFFDMNPAITNASITRALAGTRYNSLQIELRRRLTHRPAPERELHVRAEVRVVFADAADKSDLSGRDGRAALVQDELALRDSSRPWPPLRVGHQIRS